MIQSETISGASERVWQEMTLTKVGRLGDVMQGSTGTQADGGGTMRPPNNP